MSIRNLIIFLLFSTIMVSCGTSTDIKKINTVTVNGEYENGGYDVELSRSVVLPISKADAIFIMEECYTGYNSSLGEPELIDGVWEFSWGPEFPDFHISVNRDDGAVSLSLFG